VTGLGGAIGALLTQETSKNRLALQGGRHGGYQSQNNAGDAETKRIGVCGFEHFGSTAR
jgi:hypothetical protein